MRGMRSLRIRIIQDKFSHKNKCKIKRDFGIRIISNFTHNVKLY
jgi:hypothetical protein